MNGELVNMITYLKKNNIDCPIFVPLYSLNEYFFEVIFML